MWKFLDGLIDWFFLIVVAFSGMDYGLQGEWQVALLHIFLLVFFRMDMMKQKTIEQLNSRLCTCNLTNSKPLKGRNKNVGEFWG